eukprot:5950728-Alexandrium_andersonii.AAC.1
MCIRDSLSDRLRVPTYEQLNAASTYKSCHHRTSVGVQLRSSRSLRGIELLQPGARIRRAAGVVAVVVPNVPRLTHK